MESILSPQDEAQGLDIFKYQEDFTEDVQVWNQEIPPYQQVKPQICVWDIETRTLNPHDENAYILSIEAELRGKYYVWDLGFNDDNTFYPVLDREKVMLQSFITWLESDSNYIYAITGHNIFNFDIPYLMARCKYHGIHNGFVMAPGWRGRRTEVKNSMMYGRTIEFDNIKHRKFSIIDTMHLCGISDKMKATLSEFNLKYVCSPAGYNLRESRVEIPGGKIFEVYQDDKKRYFQYLHDDITDTSLLIDYLLPPLYYLLTYIPNINLQDLIFAGNGQLWNKIITKHYGNKPMTDNKYTYPGGFTGVQSGVFTECAKFDVGSLYPSIMLGQRVHSSKDPDMYQLKVLSLIRRKRLHLKDLGNQGNKEADYQSLALKILINSGYGVLGTIGIPYNDMSAAARVTAYGRKVLDYMIWFCKANGGIIVQADTDGIIVQHDNLEGIHTALEKFMPDWVSIDLEASYDLVWIYKRKNYITYKDGKARAIGIVRKRDKCKLYRDYLTFLPQLYSKHGMDAVDNFNDALIKDIQDRKIDVSQLSETKKMIEYKDDKTQSKITADLEAKPGDKVTYYRYDKTEEYITPATKKKRTRKVVGYKRIEDFNEDYSIEYYTNEIMKFKENKKGIVTQEGWYHMFKRSITNPINETSSGIEL